MTANQTPQPSINPQTVAQYKAEVIKTTELLVQLGIMDYLDDDADLVKAVVALSQKIESNELALYGEILSEDQLRAKIAKKEEQIRQVKAKMAEYEAEIRQINEDKLKAEIAQYEEQIRQIDVELAKVDVKLVETESNQEA